jgi:hypothetical protein
MHVKDAGISPTVPHSPTTTVATQRSVTLRDEALKLLDGKGAILDLARELSQRFRDAGIRAAVVGGVAVVLHGHVRTTLDVDVLVEPPLEPIVGLLTAHGFDFNPQRREFTKHGIPVHLVVPDQAGPLPEVLDEIEGIATVPLARLINMKLRSGTRSLARAQDLADVVGLIRHRRLGTAFARHLDKDLRPEFRKLVRAVEADRA